MKPHHNIHPSELLHKRTKESRINEQKKKKNLKDDLHFLLDNTLTRLFKELNIYIYIYIRMTINNN